MAATNHIVKLFYQPINFSAGYLLGLFLWFYILLMRKIVCKQIPEAPA